MRTVLFGGTDLTQAVGRALGDTLVAVITVPAHFQISYSPSRVRNARYQDMAAWAGDRGVPWHEWTGATDAQPFIAGTGADWGVAAGWYHMVPRALRALFPAGVAGVHASLLPAYRGNAPLNWALLNREQRTGVSLFELADGVDEGRLYGQRSFAIDPRETIGTLVGKAEVAAVDLVRQTLAAMEAGTATLTPQQGEPTYCLQRVPADGRIDWTSTAGDIDLLVRATSRPYPGAFTTLDGTEVRIWASTPLASPLVYGQPGQIFRLGDGRVVVTTGESALEILEAETDDGCDALPLLGRCSQRRFDDRPQPVTD